MRGVPTPSSEGGLGTLFFPRRAVAADGVGARLLLRDVRPRRSATAEWRLSAARSAAGPASACLLGGSSPAPPLSPDWRPGVSAPASDGSDGSPRGCPSEESEERARLRSPEALMVWDQRVELAVGVAVGGLRCGIQYSSRLTDLLIGLFDAGGARVGAGIAVDRDFGASRRHRWLVHSTIAMNLRQVEQV